MKLSKKITIRIKEEDLDFINRQIQHVRRSLGIDFTVGNFIRRCIGDCKGVIARREMIRRLIENGDETISNKIQEQTSNLYDINNITSCRKKNTYSNSNQEKVNKNNEYYRTVNFRISEDERKFIENQVRLINEEHAAHISIGDFVRFCINENKKNEIIYDVKQKNDL